ncbi:MAG: SOS response-associated peptidase family protein [Polaromonas sp.]|nr:SOS response-associated peptidase family protein [Polaromonas sp.]
MTTQYESLHPATFYADVFRVEAPAQPIGRNVWPRQPGVFIRQGAVPAGAATGDAGDDSTGEPAEAGKRPHELITGQFGLVPRWVKSASDAKLRSTKLVNAASDSVTTSTNFRQAWLDGQRCIVPVMAFIEEDWRSGKAVPTRIARVDGQPMGIAGLWESWTGADGEVITSYCLLTLNANNHALISRYQHPGNEKRMPAILNEGGYDAWLSARPEKAKEFVRAYPANWLLANPVEKGGRGREW